MKQFIAKTTILFSNIALSLSQAHAEIIAVQSFEELIPHVEKIAQGTEPSKIFMAFDIDLTLIQGNHPALYMSNILKYPKAWKEVFENISPEKKDIALTKAVSNAKAHPVEKEAPKIVKSFQMKGFKTFAFTASLTGKSSDNKNKFIFKRRNQLKKAGYDFSRSLNMAICAVFGHFKMYAGGYPTFFHGVLSSNGEGNEDANKGSVLGHFLKYLATPQKATAFDQTKLPKVLIMIDDKEKNLQDVENYLKQNYPQIRFLGFTYEAAKKLPAPEISETEFRKFWKKQIS